MTFVSVNMFSTKLLLIQQFSLASSAYISFENCVDPNQKSELHKDIVQIFKLEKSHFNESLVLQKQRTGSVCFFLF